MKPDRILAIKLADLGDLLITEPALRGLRCTFPRASIDVLTTPSASNLVPLIDRTFGVLTFDKHSFDAPASLSKVTAPLLLGRFGASLRRRRYDMVVIFHHLTTPAGAIKVRVLAAATGAPVVAGLDNGRGTFLTHRAVDLGFGKRHEVDYMLDIVSTLGVNVNDRAPRVKVKPTSEFQPLPAERYAVLFPVTGPFAPGRNWPVDKFAELATLLGDQGMTPIIAGASDAIEPARLILNRYPNAIDLSGRTTLEDLIALMSGAEVVVTGDSFPGHLAAALDVPMVSIFGPSNHRAWAPYGSLEDAPDFNGKHLIVRHDVPCAPCLYTGYRLGRRTGCASRTCLTNLMPDEVMRAVAKTIEATG